jgi:hypothetical protein
MSFVATEWARRQTVGLMSAKAVLNELAELADAEGFAYPGTKWLAKKCECSVRTVCRALRMLIDLGFATQARRVDAKGHRVHDGYLLVLDANVSRDNEDAPRCQDDTRNKKKDSVNESRRAPSSQTKRAVGRSPRGRSARPPSTTLPDRVNISAKNEPELFRLLEQETPTKSVPRSRSNCWGFPSSRVEYFRAELARKRLAPNNDPPVRCSSFQDEGPADDAYAGHLLCNVSQDVPDGTRTEAHDNERDNSLATRVASLAAEQPR